MNLRDPVLYRILHAEHHRTGSKWCIYPMYDWAHGQSDAIEGVTHSLCTLEFEDHRPLYDWFLDHIDGIHLPQQIEFARLNLTYTLTSKRKLRRLIDEGLVDGWDDPRMPTLTALRRRGCPPEAIRDLCARVGLTKNDSVVDLSQLEFAIRNELNRTAPRAMAVLRPLKVVIENYPEDHEEELDAINNPEDASAGTRKVPFSRVLYIERDDFRRDPPRKFFRLAPGREVRLRYAYFITCTEAIEDEEGNVVELRCTYDPATRGGDAPDGRKVKATLHWVSAAHAIKAEVRLYDRLFNHPNPAGGPRRDRGSPESGFARGAERLPAGTEPGRSRPGRPSPVRAARLLLRRIPDSRPERPGVQSDGDATGYVGEDRAGAEGGEAYSESGADSPLRGALSLSRLRRQRVRRPAHPAGVARSAPLP